jgi:hypothetical protein
MNKCYLLLRNNKETGPYTVTDLLQLSLTPNDLVWVEGKSAGWRYPFELEELKEAVIINPASSESAANNTQKQSDTMPLEGERQRAKKIFVSLPTAIKKQPKDPAPSFEEKAEAVRQKAVSFSKEKEVSHARSLNDIKEEYAGWIQEQKRERRRLTMSKPLLFTLLFTVITAATFFLLQWKPQQQRPAPALVSASKELAPVISKNTVDTDSSKEVETREEVIQPILKQERPRVISTNRITVPSVDNLPPLPIEDAPKILPVDLPAEAVANKKAAEDIPVTDLIQTSSHYTQNKEGIGLSIELHNKGDKNIRVAAVDVIYFNKAKAQIAKETLYFSNVQPGAVLTKNSSPKKAASASYRLGLVSAESAGLYVMQ